jgi:hypothetical protein
MSIVLDRAEPSGDWGAAYDGTEEVGGIEKLRV